MEPEDIGAVVGAIFLAVLLKLAVVGLYYWGADSFGVDIHSQEATIGALLVFFCSG